jgi:predicted nuclease with TOPRIM domain
MAMDVEAEIRDLKRRVGELEGSFGFLTRQIGAVHTDLLAFQARTEQRFEKIDARFDRVEGRLDKVEGRFDRVEGRLDRVETRLGRVESGLDGLREDLPGIVGEAMRAVLRETRDKSRKEP